MPPNIPGKKSISVIIPEDLYEAIKSWAETKEWSLSKAARKLIEIGFDKETGTTRKPVKSPKVK